VAVSSNASNAATGYLFKVSTGAGSSNKVVSFLNGASKGLYIDSDGYVRITDQLYIAGHRMNFTDLAAGNIPIGTYYVDMAEITAPANPAAGSCRFYVDSSTHQIVFKNSAGTSCLASSGTGTVTHTGGALTLNSLMAGAGTDDAKVLAADPTNCSAGQAPTGIDKTGAAKGCFTPSGSLPAGVTSDGSNGLTVTGAVTAASVVVSGASSITLPDGGTAGANKLTSAATGILKWNTLPVAFTVASGTAAMPTSSIAAGACATVVTVSATGVATTDVISWTPNADISGVTGYTPAGTLRIYPYPTANNANFKVCNGHATDAVTPGAVTLNFRVTR
jgi:hypothetical protein